MTTLTPELMGQINYWAVLVTALLCFFLGGLWYSPALFESAWMAANGYDADQVAAFQKQLGAGGFASAFLAYLAMAVILALLLSMLGVNSLAGGIAVAALVWLGFVATTGLTVNLFSIKPLIAWVIDAAFQLVALSITGAVLGAWR